MGSEGFGNCLASSGNFPVGSIAENPGPSIAGGLDADASPLASPCPSNVLPAVSSASAILLAPSRALQLCPEVPRNSPLPPFPPSADACNRGVSWSSVVQHNTPGANSFSVLQVPTQDDHVDGDGSSPSDHLVESSMTPPHGNPILIIPPGTQSTVSLNEIIEERHYARVEAHHLPNITSGTDVDPGPAFCTIQPPANSGPQGLAKLNNPLRLDSASDGSDSNGTDGKPKKRGLKSSKKSRNSKGPKKTSPLSPVSYD
ncbi:hypothetical protein Nepgr_008063 [Nepenthes gracilis]|uniref:Uncharacterized protein n=1 Tax=Nepenthes gracilis TaxID=150966 RepID=A0AAD3XIW4_NEPGR|nr:hypothetical protein Nepgr_008063 [Nepenthes gracilis]